MIGPATAMPVVLIVVTALVGVRARRRRAGRRRSAVDGSLGFTVDLVTVVVGSGGTVRQAVAAVAVDGPVPVRASFQEIVDHADRGHLLADSLAEAAIELGPVFHPLLGALLGAEVDGAPLGSVLSRLTDDIESHDRWRAEASAGRLPVALLPPLVLCLLPSVLVGAVVPLAIVALRQVG